MSKKNSIVCRNPDCKELYTYEHVKGHKRKVCPRVMCIEWNEAQVRKRAAQQADDKAQAYYDVANKYYTNLEGHESRFEFLGNLYEEIKVYRAYIPRDLRRSFCEARFNYREDKNGKCIPGLAQAFYNFCRDNRGNTPMEIFKKGKEGEIINIDKAIKAKELSFTVAVEDGKQARSYNSAEWLAAHNIEGTVEAMTGGLVKLSALKEEQIEKAKKKAEAAAKKASKNVKPNPDYSVFEWD